MELNTNLVLHKSIERKKLELMGVITIVIIFSLAYSNNRGSQKESMASTHTHACAVGYELISNKTPLKLMEDAVQIIRLLLVQEARIGVVSIPPSNSGPVNSLQYYLPIAKRRMFEKEIIHTIRMLVQNQQNVV